MLTDHYSTHVYIYSLYQKCFHIKSAASKVLASISDANWWCYAPMHTQLYSYHSVRLGSDSVTFSCCGGSWRSCTASPTPLFPCQPLSRPSTLVSQVYRSQCITCTLPVTQSPPPVLVALWYRSLGVICFMCAHHILVYLTHPWHSSDSCS